MKKEKIHLDFHRQIVVIHQSITAQWVWLVIQETKFLIYLNNFTMKLENLDGKRKKTDGFVLFVAHI